MKYTKTNPNISFAEFVKKLSPVTDFSSSTGKRYKVVKHDATIIYFKRLDSDNPDDTWNFDLSDLFKAYKTLTDFDTVNFKPFVPIRHSPARGLLISTGLLVPIKS